MNGPVVFCATGKTGFGHLRRVSTIAHSLRVRGVEVDEERYPPQKLIPMKQTKVVPVS